jgi:hypothetical protein
VAGVRGLDYRVIPPVSRNATRADASALPPDSATPSNFVLPNPPAAVPTRPPPSQISLPSATVKKTAPRKLRKGLYYSLSLLAALVLVAAVIFLRRAPPKSVIVTGTPFRFVAVLPFDNLSADHSDDYLAVGLSENGSQPTSQHTRAAGQRSDVVIFCAPRWNGPARDRSKTQCTLSRQRQRATHRAAAWYGELCLALYTGDWRKAAGLEFNRPKQLRDVDYDFLPVFAIQWYGSKTKELTEPSPS